MSLSFNTLVVSDVLPAEAGAMGEQVTRRLVESGIVVPAPDPAFCECQFVEGPNAAFATRAINRSRHTGLNVILERTVFHAGEAGLDALVCPNCNDSVSESTVQWSDAISNWYRGDDVAQLRCSNCGKESPIVHWKFEPSWALSCLGFEFEGWFLTNEFVETVSNWLNRRVLLVDCHI